MDKLSEYPMLEIFKFLPSKELKVASTVCKDWRRIIFSSKRLLGKWTLKVDFDAKLQKKKNRSKLRLQKRFIQKYGPFFTKAIISGRFSKKLLKSRFFEALRNVRTLSLIDVAFLLLPDSDDCDFIKFPSLETLNITNFLSDPSHLNHLEPLNLTITRFTRSNPLKFAFKWLPSRKNLLFLELNHFPLLFHLVTEEFMLQHSCMDTVVAFSYRDLSLSQRQLAKSQFLEEHLTITNLSIGLKILCFCSVDSLIDDLLVELYYIFIV